LKDLSSLSPCEIHRIEPSRIASQIDPSKISSITQKFNRFQIWALSDRQVYEIFNHLTPITTSTRDLLFDMFSRLDLIQINIKTMKLFSLHCGLPFSKVQPFVQRRSLSLDQLEKSQVDLIRREQIRNSDIEVQRCLFLNLFLTRNVDLPFRLFVLDELNLTRFNPEEILSIVRFFKDKYKNIDFYLVTQFFAMHVCDEYFDRVHLDRIMQDALRRNYLKIWNDADIIDFPIGSSMFDPYSIYNKSVDIFSLIQVAHAEQELQSVFELAAYVLSLQQLDVLLNCLCPDPNDRLQLKNKIRWFQYCCDATHTPFVT